MIEFCFHYQWSDALLCCVIISGGIVAHHFSFLDMNPFSNTVDLIKKKQQPNITYQLAGGEQILIQYITFSC